MMLGLLGSVYVAFSPVLIGGLLLPQFGRALAVVGLMHLFRLSDFAVRMPDQFFLGAGRTGTSSWLVGIAHATYSAYRYLCRALRFLRVVLRFHSLGHAQSSGSRGR